VELHKPMTGQREALVDYVAVPEGSWT
jgi:hypothetical protein